MQNNLPSLDNLREKISGTLSNNSAYALNNQAWWLLGTVGCHLCDDAENILRLFSGVQPIIIQKVDISDFDEALMNEFATAIPVILTPNKQLNFPFSIVDLQSAYSLSGS